MFGLIVMLHGVSPRGFGAQVSVRNRMTPAYLTLETGSVVLDPAGPAEHRGS